MSPDNKQNEKLQTPLVALIGPPNAGKTTLFNCLTGLRYKVANYPGVTVEKKSGRLCLKESACEIIDLPGLYSLHGESEDEAVSERFLEGVVRLKRSFLAVIVVDSSNIERNLPLVSQILEKGYPAVLALNMIDEAQASGLQIRESLLSQMLGIPVVKISAKLKLGLTELKNEIEQKLKIPENKTGSFPLKIEGRDEIADINSRYNWANEIFKQTVRVESAKQQSLTAKLDRFLMHPVLGLIFFAFVMGLVFQGIFTWAQWPMDQFDNLVVWISKSLSAVIPEGKLQSLLVDGIVAGVGGVLIFIPQITILFFFIGILEDTGYLCRAAFLTDRLMRPFGMQGRSFIPLLSSFACAVPGIMAARTIYSRSNRLITILIAPLMSCSARIPVYTLLIAAFIPATKVAGLSLQGLTLLSLYLMGVFAALAAGFCFKKFLFKKEPALFVMEMPPYRRPSLKKIIREVYDRVLTFVKSAGTVILLCSIILWFLGSYPHQEGLSASEAMQISFAGKIGNFLEPVFRPLGFDWPIVIGIFAAFAAREVFVSALATFYSIENSDAAAKSLTDLLTQKYQSGEFTLASAIALLVFFVFACQCVSTLVICRKETGSWKWPILMFIYMTVLAYLAAFFAHEIVTYLN
jgi:ferrous iron transport protein B